MENQLYPDFHFEMDCKQERKTKNDLKQQAAGVVALTLAACCFKSFPGFPVPKAKRKRRESERKPTKKNAFSFTSIEIILSDTRTQTYPRAFGDSSNLYLPH